MRFWDRTIPEAGKFSAALEELSEEQVKVAPMPINSPELSAIFFRIGGLMFGGGNASIAALHREHVTKREWLSQTQFEFYSH